MGHSYAQNMQRLVEQYREADQPWLTTARRIAAWAIENDLWKPHPSKIRTLCAEQISKAIREEYYIDPQGRRVRTKQAIPMLFDFTDDLAEIEAERNAKDEAA